MGEVMIFETHAHYEDKAFDGDREELLSSLKEKDIFRVVNVASSLETTEKSIALAEQHAFIYASAGVHPSDVSELSEEGMEQLFHQTQHLKAVAVGEIGLDYYWEKDADAQKEQRYWFARQLQLAKETGLPVIIHSRDAAADTLRVMKEEHTEQISGVIHCFSYSMEMAESFLKMGFYIGIGGVVTFKNAKKLKEVAAKIPLERILLETDCPYMAPEPHRGERNSSLYLPFIAEKIAELRGISAEEVIEATCQNAFRMYGKMPQLTE